MALVATTLSITLSSCGIALNEGNGNPDASMKLSDPGVGCIEHSLPKIEKYFKATATDKETYESWNCVNSALQMFHDKVRGQDPNFYTPEELRTFLVGSGLLGKINLTTGFLDEVFRLKQIFLGGERRRLSRAELIKLMESIRILQYESIRLLPHMKIVMQMTPPEKATASEVLQAKIALNEMGDAIGRIFAHAEVVYAKEHADALLTELQALFKQTNSKWEGPTTAKKYLSSFFVFKSFLLHPTLEAVFPDEWSSILSLVSRLYGSLLQITYLVQPASDLFYGDGRGHMDQLMAEVFGILQRAVDNKTNKVIAFEQIDSVISELYSMKILKEDFLKVHTLKNLVKNVITKMYHPSVDGVRPIATGIDTKVLNLMKSDYAGFSDMQGVYEGIQRDLVAAGKAVSYDELRKLWPTPAKNSNSHAAQIHRLLSQTKPIIWDDELRVVYDDNGFQLPMTPRKFTELNWRRMFLYLLARGYSADGKTVETKGLQPCSEFRHLYLDFKDLAAELEFLDPTETTIWKSTSDESMIFFLSSDGKVPVSISEGYDFMSMALGAGKMSSPAYDEMRKNCKHTATDDYFGKPLIDLQCYRKTLVDNFDRYFASLPNWVNAVKSLNNGELQKFQKNLEYVTLKFKDKPETGVQAGDLGKTASVFQYAESIFWRFDTNRNGLLNLEEAMVAYPIFHDYLASAAKMTKEKDIEALFTYLLRYKRAPRTIIQKVEFLIWQRNKNDWKFDVSRIDVIEIIAAMKRQAAEAEQENADSSAPADECK